MEGWLSAREWTFPPRWERFYFKMQRGFLSQHLTESSVKLKTYCLHKCDLKVYPEDRKISVELGQFGVEFARAAGNSRNRRLLLVADNTPGFRAWVTTFDRARWRKIEMWYTLGRQLGYGADGIVVLGAKCEKPANKVAVKRIPLSPTRNGESLGEVLARIQRETQLQHKAAQRTRYVADVVDVFFDDDYCFIVMAYGNGGSLSDLLEEKEGAIPEDMVRCIAIQLAQCLFSLHKNQIIHRDIKCDNIVLNKDSTANIQILVCDFGFASRWRPNSGYNENRFCKGLIGTTLYLAPEVARGERYGFAADVFSFGVLCFVSLAGRFPFGKNRVLSEGSDTSKQFELLEKQKHVSPAAVSFCKALLNDNPIKRLTALALLQHEWLRDRRLVSSKGRSRPKDTITSKAVFRRVFHAISAMNAFLGITGRHQKWSKRSPQSPPNGSTMSRHSRLAFELSRS